MKNNAVMYIRFASSDSFDDEKSHEKKRVAVYIHHATDGYWRTWQPKMLQDYVREQGGAVVGTYVESGYVGRKRCRPELEKLLKECESGNIDEVAILKESHLSRNMQEFIAIYERLKKCGVSLSIMQQRADNSIDETINMIKAVGYGT